MAGKWILRRAFAVSTCPTLAPRVWTMNARSATTGGRLSARRVVLVAGLVVGLLAAPGPAHAHASAGALDRSFGSDGGVTTDFAGGFDRAGALVVQTDGKLVAAGSAGIPAPAGSGTDFALVRYHRDGSVD